MSACVYVVYTPHRVNLGSVVRCVRTMRQNQCAGRLGSENYRFLEPYTMVGLIFLALSLPTAGLIRAFEGYVRHKLGM
jgi:ABC-type amino acid transport system permease subunit